MYEKHMRKKIEKQQKQVTGTARGRERAKQISVENRFVGGGGRRRWESDSALSQAAFTVSHACAHVLIAVNALFTRTADGGDMGGKLQKI